MHCRINEPTLYDPLNNEDVSSLFTGSFVRFRDGMGKGTHLSFFFVVMTGPFDALLPWPFKHMVTLAIINQTGKKHVTDSFRPDPLSTHSRGQLRRR